MTGIGSGQGDVSNFSPGKGNSAPWPNSCVHLALFPFSALAASDQHRQEALTIIQAGKESSIRRPRGDEFGGFTVPKPTRSQPAP